MTLHEQLGIQRGVTAVMGSGGKTSLLRVLGQELCQIGTVLLCTTTKIMAFEGVPKLEDLTQEGALFWTGTSVEGTMKYTVPAWDFDTLCTRFDYVLVEADGSAGLPLKAHLPHEPVIPTQANDVLCLVGLTGFGKPISQVVHRKERFAQLCGAQIEDAVTPELVAQVLQAEKFCTQVICNQADTIELQGLGQQLAQLLDVPTHVVALKRRKVC